MDSIIKVKNLGFSYKKNKVLDDLGFKVLKSSIFGLAGKNGAGKTTLMQILLGILKPQQGNIQISGYDYRQLPEGKIGYLSERPYYHLDFRLKEYLFYLARISPYGVDEEQIDRAIELVSLEDSKTELLGKFSKGMLQRVGLAQTFLHRPELLILDEPLSGLDPVGQNRLREIILNINDRGTTILITSHNLYEIERLSDEIGILHKGKIKIIDVKGLNQKQKIKVEFESGRDDITALFKDYSKVEVSRDKLIFPADNDSLYYSVMKILIDNNIKISKLFTSKVSLEEIILKYLDESSDRNE
ncbi:MAG TPA: ABC transporter ATP-binding protein [Halanaerobiales bacterium]|nr:ABC transporter ATP-binding protein [Halanaerobiales bacterium]